MNVLNQIKHTVRKNTGWDNIHVAMDGSMLTIVADTNFRFEETILEFNMATRVAISGKPNRLGLDMFFN